MRLGKLCTENWGLNWGSIFHKLKHPELPYSITTAPANVPFNTSAAGLASPLSSTI